MDGWREDRRSQDFKVHFCTLKADESAERKSTNWCFFETGEAAYKTVVGQPERGGDSRSDFFQTANLRFESDEAAERKAPIGAFFETGEAAYKAVVSEL